MIYIYSAVFEPLDSGSFLARVPDLPGCVTTGSSLADAIEQITDAASVWLVVAEDEGFDIPAPSEQAALDRPSGSFCSLVQVDSLAYRARTDTRCVRKNVSLPAWMAAMADKRGINCSQVLQESLAKLLSSPA